HQVEISLLHGDIGDICGPYLIWTLGGQVPQQVGIRFVVLAPSGGMFSRKDCLKPHYLVVEPFDRVPAHFIAFVFGQPDVHPLGPFEGVVDIRFVHLPHELQVQFGFAPGLIVQPGTMDRQCFALFYNAHLGMTLAYHFSAFGEWSQRKASFKKSFSTFNWPMAFRSLSFSLSVSLRASFLPDSNTCSAPSRKSRFHALIWVGCISYFWASSARLCRSFKASNTTLVLNFGVNFLRVIFSKFND